MFNIVRACQRVDRICNPGFMLKDKLGISGNP